MLGLVFTLIFLNLVMSQNFSKFFFETQPNSEKSRQKQQSANIFYDKVFRWTQPLCQKILIFFLSCLLQSCFGNEKFTKEFYFLYQVASKRRVLRLLSEALESTHTITSYITVDIFVQRCPKIMSWFPKQIYNLFQFHYS